MKKKLTQEFLDQERNRCLELADEILLNFKEKNVNIPLAVTTLGLVLSEYVALQCNKETASIFVESFKNQIFILIDEKVKT